MDVSSIVSSSIVRTGLLGTASVQPVTFLLNPSATTSVNSVEVVDISGLGQLLSASSIFETGVLKSAESNQASFPTVVAATQFFVDTLNDFLQSGSLQSSLGGSLGNLFTQMLNTQSTANSGDGKSILASLSAIGINLQEPTSDNVTGLMTADFETLQSAFNADQLGTVTVLAQTTQSIGQLAAEFANLFVQVSDFTQSTQSSPDADTLNGLLAAATGTAAATGALSPGAVATVVDTAATARVVAATKTPATAGASTVTGGAAATGATATTDAAAATGVTATAETTGTIGAAAPSGTLAVTETPAAPTGAVPLGTTVDTAVDTAAIARAIAATGTPVAMEAATTGTTAATRTTTATRTTAETNAVATTPPAATTLSATAPVTTTEPVAAPIAARLATRATLPTTLVAVAAAASTTAPTAVAPAAIPQNLVNPIIDASNPAVAAAIAAYHVIDGIFESSKPRVETNPESFPGYSEIRPVTPTKPVKLDLHA